MGLHRRLAERQPVADLGVGAARRQQPQYLELARR